MSRVAVIAVLLASSFLPHSDAFYSARFAASSFAPQQAVRHGCPSETVAASSAAGVGGGRRSRFARARGAGAAKQSSRPRFASHAPARATTGALSMMSADVSEGDVVVVVGASGRLGSLVTQSLASTGKYKVRGLVRSVDKAKETLGLSSAGGDSGLEIELMQGNISDEESLGAAMKGAACVVACTGTTAFPSKLWTGGNTPDAVDNLAVGNLLRAAEAGGNLKRFILLSSVGVTRGDKFPFFILNAFGVLDAKAAGEARVRKAAEEGGFSYSIVRPGQVQGDPFLTYSKAKGATLSPDAPEKGSAKRMVSVKQGDTEAGDVNPSSVAEAFTQAVSQAGAAGKSYTVVDKLGDIPTQETWDEIFAKL